MPSVVWTYNDGLATPRDLVRFLVGDTDAERPLVSDAAVDVFLVKYGDPAEAAASICDGLAVKFGRIATITVDGLTVSGKDRAMFYQTTAFNLRRSSQFAPGALGVPSVFGVDVGAMRGVDQDTNRPPSKNRVGMLDFPGVINTAEAPPENSESLWWP